MNPDPATKLLADLVAIPSMNPMGRTRSGPEYSEKNLADFIAAFLGKNGIDVEVYESSPGRPNVMGFVDAGASKTLMLEVSNSPEESLTVHVAMNVPSFE